MKNAIKLFVMDLKRIAKTPAVWLILGGLAILPSFYAWFNLQASWDPYGNTKNIKIAIVNEDHGDTVRGKKINVGDKLTDKLKKDDNFDWQFVSRDKADHDVKMGKNYAAIYIPKDFTHQITGTLRKKPQQAKIEYKVNQKINAIAPKMTDAGTSTIVQKANDKFDGTVTKIMLEEANKLGIKLEKEIPTINKIQSAVSKANAALPQINTFADKLIYLDAHQDQLDNYADRFRKLDQYKGDAVNAADKLNQVNSAIPALNERAKLVLALNQYMPNIERALNVASNDVPQAFPKINRGVDIANQGVDAGLRGLDDAEAYLPAIQQRVGSYQQVVKNAQQANQNANQTLRDRQQTSTAQQNTKSAHKTSHPYHTSQLSANESANDDTNSNAQPITRNDTAALDNALAKSLLTLSRYADQRAESSMKDMDALENMAYGIVATDNAREFERPLRHVKSRLQDTSQFNQQFIDILSDIEKREHVDLSPEIDQLEKKNAKLDRLIKKDDQLIKAIHNGEAGKAEAIALLKDIPKVHQDFNHLRSYLQHTLNNKLLNVSDQITAALNASDVKLSEVQHTLNTVGDVIDSGKNILTVSRSHLRTLQSELPIMEQHYTDAMKVAQGHFPKFKKDVGEAASFVRNDLPALEQRLADTTATVNKNLPVLFSKYDHALNLLNTNQPKAKKELHELAQFAKYKLPDVEKDIKKANRIFSKLEKDDAVDKLVDLLKNDLKKQADVISNPIDIDQKDYFPVKDYGSASTPFYTALAVWVGALLQVSLLTTDNKHQSLRSEVSTRQVYLGKMGLFYLIGVLQALIVSTGDIVLLHADVESVPLFIGITVFSSFIFVTIVYTLVSLLGNPGKALAIIILVLQIAGGGGTFPIEVTPHFFQAIHPFLPFSYAIDALREAVGGPVPQILTHKLVMLALFGIGFFLIGIIFKPISDPIMRKATKKAEESNIME